jgi:phosphoenolpyruvate carboxylase
MQKIADYSRETYHALVDLKGDFAKYYRGATPIDVIERLNMVSIRDRDEVAVSAQTSARRWEYAWVQNRCLIPAWYGFARGVEAAIEAHGQDALSVMFAEWPFARVLMADIELALAKADIKMAERYSELAGKFHDKYFPVIREEHDRSIQLVLSLTGQSELLENSPALSRTIRLRNPYVDPMSFLQVDLLRRWRESGRKDDAVLRALRASINGIAHGMQNTG